MKRIVCFGEALIDFLNTGHSVDGQLSLNTFTQFPGGAPANAAVAAAKLGGDAAFAGQVGDDQFGRFLLDSLNAYGVDTSLAATHPTAKTALAFVFLDDSGERSFSFRRDGTADVVLTKAQVQRHWFDREPIVHFCSNTLTDTAIAEVTRHFVDSARHSGAIVSFDVNLRHNLWQSGHADANVVSELVRRSDIVKFSREELDYLSHGESTAYLAACFDAGLGAALVTDGGKEITVRIARSEARVTPPPVDVVDTTGGGDAFIGAVLFGLSLRTEPLDYLRNVEELRQLVSSAAHCGAFAVTRQGAFPAFPTMADVKAHWTA